MSTWQPGWQRSRWRGDEGGAIVELTFLGVLLLVPLTYALITAFQVQGAAYALTAASRDAGRAAVQAESWESANDRARVAADVVLEGAGLESSAVVMRLSCGEDPCLTSGSKLDVHLTTRVPLPWIPPFIDSATSVAVSADHHVRVDRFREDRS